MTIEATSNATQLSNGTIAVVLVIFWLFVVAISYLQQKLIEARGVCSVGCGRPYACRDCCRCDDRDCNAGCISCRPRSEWDPISRSINQLGERLGLHGRKRT